MVRKLLPVHVGCLRCRSGTPTLDDMNCFFNLRSSSSCWCCCRCCSAICCWLGCAAAVFMPLLPLRPDRKACSLVSAAEAAGGCWRCCCCCLWCCCWCWLSEPSSSSAAHHIKLPKSQVLRAGKPALCGTWIEGTCSELEALEKVHQQESAAAWLLCQYLLGAGEIC